MWNLTSLRAARACRKLGRVATRVCSAVSQEANAKAARVSPGRFSMIALLVADCSVDVPADVVDRVVVLLRHDLLGET